MARYKTIDQETWLPDWAREHNIPATGIKLRHKNGTSTVIPIPEEYQHGGGFEFETLDSQTIRTLDADPRFERIS